MYALLVSLGHFVDVPIVLCYSCFALLAQLTFPLFCPHPYPPLLDTSLKKLQEPAWRSEYTGQPEKMFNSHKLNARLQEGK